MITRVNLNFLCSVWAVCNWSEIDLF